MQMKMEMFIAALVSVRSENFKIYLSYEKDSNTRKSLFKMNDFGT